MNEVAALFVAYNSGPLLIDAVRRVLESPGVEVVVADNASSDGIPEQLLAMNHPRVRVLRMGRNSGFAVACNAAAAQTTASILAFVNPDCLLPHDALPRMRGVLQQHPEIGLLGADVRDSCGHPEAAARRRDPTLARLLIAQLARLPGLRRWAPHGLQVAVSTQNLQEVEAVSGALMVMPRAAFAAVSGFDSGFFLHAEDLDLCRRVRAAGYRVVVANQVTVEHRQGGSSRSRPWFVIRHKHASLWRYFVVHDGYRVYQPRAWVLLAALILRAAAQSAKAALIPLIRRG